MMACPPVSQLPFRFGVVKDLLPNATNPSLEELYLALAERREALTTDHTCIWDHLGSVSSFVRDVTESSDYNMVCSAIKFKGSIIEQSTAKDSGVQKYTFIPRSRLSVDLDIFHMQWVDTRAKTHVRFVQFLDVKKCHHISFNDNEWKPTFNSAEFARILKMDTPFWCLQYKQDAIAWVQLHDPEAMHLLKHVVQLTGRESHKRRKLTRSVNEHMDYSAFEKIDWPLTGTLDKDTAELWTPDALKLRFSHLQEHKLQQVLRYAATNICV